MTAILKPGEHRQTVGAESDEPRVGDWFVDLGKEGKKLWCVTAIGSNYVKLSNVYNTFWRVHADEFWSTVERAVDAEGQIQAKISHYRAEMQRLMNETRALAARLHVAPMAALGEASGETQALATSHGTGPIKQYKKDLVTAKEKTLPELFEAVDKAAKSMSAWMKASLLPLRAEAEGLKSTLEAVKDRIFSVELYAGLSEEVERIKDGDPAPNDTRIHLFQRRHYMDEECLVGYEHGGMNFEKIGDFERWLLKPANLGRLLPFPRCVVAFRVRREKKEYKTPTSLGGFIKLQFMHEADKKTFLYMRNGEQVHRLATEIEFGAQLFPDPDHRLTLSNQKLWAKTWGNGSIDKVISDGEYQEMLRNEAENREMLKTCPKTDRWKYDRLERSNDFYEHTPNNVYYDDVNAYIADEIKAHNRVVLVLQGLLDRSPVMHPHPPWQLWTPEGLSGAFELHRDDSRALSAGPKPDFEAFRARCNAALKKGSVTVGQDDIWEIVEARRENERMARSWRHKSDHEYERYRPYGNPGPGVLAKVAEFHARAGKCSYAWTRKRQGPTTWRSSNPRINCHLTVETKHLLCVDAYRPGDFRQFYDDPRTRAEYLKWAPLLLLAEEYHAGNRKVRIKDEDE